jgi:hypoxanthine phosphoribosyltransferase
VKRLYGPEEIAAAVSRLAASIAAGSAGKPILLLGVLKGALYLTVDLSRALAGIPDGPSEMMVDYICVESYDGHRRRHGPASLLCEPSTPLQGRRVVLVDDIADTGLTMGFLQAFCRERGPESVQTCVLFDKPEGRAAGVTLDHVGLTVPNAFVVGYGLDYQEQYRALAGLYECQVPMDVAP